MQSLIIQCFFFFFFLGEGAQEGATPGEAARGAYVLIVCVVTAAPARRRAQADPAG